ncbi:hypothetical protein PFISCL1PPCAC_9559 [Pristionchus fissidentatus]|uniref:Uncharacterized protein n=1 Tax=Pristionchus fissidentatus TaxID=1538716 RepID=A0AAV5VEW8_9BILA|nr:hypothetical protein PFISCL1PPCAC_9559 [Pristionchus fissidentatus]
MSTRLESTTSVKQWESERKREVEGTPPRPEDHPSTLEGERRSINIRGITPSYKTGDGKPSYDLTLGQSGHLPNAAGDYKMRQSMEHYKQTIIDPLVRSNATIPTPTIPDPKLPIGDFSSEHSRRSQVKLEPLEQRRFRSTESKPIVISDYLTKSIDRHRDMEASRLRDLLKAKESDANQPWNKPGWPGPKPNDDEKMRELDHMKKSIERLEREAAKPKKNDELDELHRRQQELLERSRRNRDSYKATDSELVKTGPEPVPAYFKEHIRDMLESRASIDTAKTTREDDAKSGYVTDVSSATWQFSTHSFSPRSVVSVNGGTQDDGLLKVRVDTEDKEPRSIMKRRELESREDMMGAGKEIAVHRDYQRSHSSMSSKPRMTQTVQRFEEHKRTEEIERRVQRKEKRERRTRHEWSESSRHGGASPSSFNPRLIIEQRRGWTPDEVNGAVRHAYRCVDQAYREIRHRSSSMSRNNQNYAIGYHPSESQWRHESMRRGGGQNGFHESGMAHARYGSMSDSLKRGELKYIPNGEVRESFYGGANGGTRMHKSYSTRDVFNGGHYDDGRSHSSSWRRGTPFVEYPPTLPRHGDSRSEYRPVSKARSYADWDDRERGGRRRDDEMSRLESEFRDANLLIPAQAGAPMNHREHRTEQIPGGYETYHKEMKGDAGRRIGRDGRPVDFTEQSNEYSFKREVDGRH